MAVLKNFLCLFYYLRCIHGVDYRPEITVDGLYFFDRYPVFKHLNNFVNSVQWHAEYVFSWQNSYSLGTFSLTVFSINSLENISISSL